MTPQQISDFLEKFTGVKPKFEMCRKIERMIIKADRPARYDKFLAFDFYRDLIIEKAKKDQKDEPVS